MQLPGVSKTAVLTLRARADEQLRLDKKLHDPWAREWMERLEWPLELNRWYDPQVQSFLAFRAEEIDRLLNHHLATVPGAVVLELGAGLSTRAQRCPGATQWIDLDLPEVIAARRSLGAQGTMLARSVLDPGWMEALPQVPAERFFLIAEGLFYYLPRAEVDQLFQALSRRLPGATICFDLVGKLDWERLRQRSAAVGAPVQWRIEPPFERALQSFGLAPHPDFDLLHMLYQHLDRNWGRFGKLQHQLVRLGARVPALRAGRSGNLIGVLKK